MIEEKRASDNEGKFHSFRNIGVFSTFLMQAWMEEVSILFESVCYKIYNQNRLLKKTNQQTYPFMFLLCNRFLPTQIISNAVPSCNVKKKTPPLSAPV